MYWNVDRDWNKTTLSTNRKPDANGWYSFRMAVDGAHVTVKTNDLTVANAMEKSICMGLKLDGDVVVEVRASSKVYPAGVFASYLYIKEIGEDGTIVAERTVDGELQTKTARLAEDCRVYNVSITSVLEGEAMDPSELKVGDTIHGYLDYNGEITMLYVVGSQSTSPIYWNIDKNEYWDSKTESSTRKPNANGYYTIRFAVEGKQVTLRTKDKKTVDNIDGRTCMAFKLDGQNILKVFSAVQTVNTKGGLFASSYHVTAISGKKITATKLAGTNAGKIESKYMAADCKIYNVCPTAKTVGEVGTVKVGDQIRCLLNEDKQISVMYILTAANHKKAHSCDHCGKNVAWLAWNGKTTITKSGHYVLNADVTATNGIKWDKDLDVTLCLNGHTLTVENRRVFGNVTGKLNIVDCVGVGHVHGTTNNNASITMIDGGTVNIYGGTFTAREITEQKNGGQFTLINGGQLNMYGGWILNGKTNGYGGNINISDGTMTVYDGVVAGGVTSEGYYGGNIALSGENAKLIIKGGEISGGTSGSYGGNIGIAKTGARVILEGGLIENGTAATHGGNITVAMGSLTVTGGKILGGTAGNYGSALSAVNDSEVSITDATLIGGQMRMSNTGGLTLGGKVNLENLHLYGILLNISKEVPLQDATVGISMKSNGVFCEDATENDLQFFHSYGSDYAPYYENNTLFLDSAVIHRHCDCGGVGEHTCDENIRWIAYEQDMVLEDGKHYHLTADTLDNITIADGATVYLCLNGQKLSSNARVFGNLSAGKTLNVYDCAGGGTVQGLTNNNAPVAMVDGGTLNIYGGTYTANEITASSKNGGILMAMNEGVINFYNGTITGGKTTGMGGCVYITNQAAFHMYGGSITDGTSASKGSTFAVAGEAVLTVLGGNIGMGSNEDCIYHNSTSPIVVGGNARIAKIFLEGTAVLTVSETAPLQTETARIGVEKTTEGVLVQNILNEQLICITNLGKGTMTWAEGVLSLSLPHSHCVCVNADVLPADHTCEDLTWQPITGSTTIIEDGSFFLDWSGNKAAAITLSDGVHAKLCLKGATIYALNTITLGEGSTLDICDCSEGKTGVITRSGGATRSPVSLDGDQTVNLYSGTVTGTNGTKSLQSVVLNHANARFNMYGGKICDGKSATYGGNVAVMKGVFTLYAGTITGGQATTHGGNITASGGSFVMKGGQVTGGTAATYGGNISFVTANSSGNLTGGAITGGTAGSYASCVYVNNNNVVIGGTVQIDELMFGGGKTATVSTEVPFAQGASVGLALQTAPTNYTTVIKGHSDLRWFVCTMESFFLDTNGNNIVIKPQS